jgi:hypothetical protein
MLVTLTFLGGVLAASCASSPTQPSSQSPSAQSPSGTPGVSQITPTASPVGTTVTITGTGFAAHGNTVKFGDGYIRDVSSPDGTTLHFTVPEGLDLCAPSNLNLPCRGAFPRVNPGDYAVAVITEGQMSNSRTFTVTGS